MGCCICCIAVLVVLYYVIRYLLELIRVGDLDKKAVFITGCDTGFGRLLALKCASEGINVFAGCFTKQGEAQYAQEPMIHSVHIDVTDQKSVDDAVSFVKRHLHDNQKLWAVVNNAGFNATHGPEEWTQIEDYQRAFDVNTIGMIRVVHAFRPLIRNSKGRFITTTSLAGRVALPFACAYSASKYATEAFADAMRRDMHQFGVKCILVEPGAYRTPFTDPEAIGVRLEASWNRLSDEQKAIYGEEYGDYCIKQLPTTIANVCSTRFYEVIDSYMHAIKARYPRTRYVCGRDGIAYLICSYLPAPICDALARAVFNVPVTPAAIAKRTN